MAYTVTSRASVVLYITSTARWVYSMVFIILQFNEHVLKPSLIKVTKSKFLGWYKHFYEYLINYFPIASRFLWRGSACQQEIWYLKCSNSLNSPLSLSLSISLPHISLTLSLPIWCISLSVSDGEEWSFLMGWKEGLSWSWFCSQGDKGLYTKGQPPPPDR